MNSSINTKLIELLNHFKLRFENLMSNEFDYQKYLKEFENLLKSSSFILKENKEYEIYSYFQSTLDHVYSIKKQLSNNLNKLIIDITTLDAKFVINLNEISSNLKKYTLNTREIYKQINDEHISILNENLMSFYNICKNIVQNIKDIHSISNEKEEKKSINNSMSLKNYILNKNKNWNLEIKTDERNVIEKKDFGKTNNHKKFFTSPNFQKIILSLNNYVKNQNLKRKNTPSYKSNNLKIDKLNENSRNKNILQNSENSFNLNNSINSNMINIANLIMDFFNYMNVLQKAIIQKDKNIHQMKINFEKKKLNLYSISKNIIENNIIDFDNSFKIKKENSIEEINELKHQLISSKMENEKLNNEFNEINQKFYNILFKLKEEINFSLYNSLNNSGKLNNINIKENISNEDLIKANNAYYNDILYYINQIKEKIKFDKTLKEIYVSLNDLQNLIDENTNLISPKNINDSENIMNILKTNKIINLEDDNNSFGTKKTKDSNITMISIINLIDKIKKNIIEKKDEIKKVNNELFKFKFKLDEKNISRNTNSFKELSNNNERTFTFQSNNENNKI